MNSLAVKLGQNVIINLIPDVYALLKSDNKTFTDVLEELEMYKMVLNSRRDSLMKILYL
jgi:hypothetical protein